MSGNDLILVGTARQLDPTNESGLWVREPPLARLTAAVMRLTGLDSVPELRRDRFGLIRNVVAAGAHLENDVRHRLQDMVVEFFRLDECAAADLHERQFASVVFGTPRAPARACRRRC